jgi:hypothetical protein
MKSKAYIFANAADYDTDDLSEQVTFAETPGKAKQDFSMENGIHYKDIRVQRAPWADTYGDVDSIPVEEWLNHGWYFICNTCGAKIEDVADFHVNSKGYCCKKCFNEWVESGIKNRNRLQNLL